MNIPSPYLFLSKEPLYVVRDYEVGTWSERANMDFLYTLNIWSFYVPKL